MNSGIYCWRNILNDKRYVGSAENLETRRKRHLWKLTAGNHHSIHFQRAWDLYGPEVFIFEILELCPKHELLFKEQKAITTFDAIRNGYNVAYIAGSPMSGRTHTKETRLKMSKARRGKPKPTGFGFQISQARKGIKFGSEPNKKAWKTRKTKPLTAKEKTAREVRSTHFRIINQSDEGRLQAVNSTKKRWESGEFEALCGQNKERLKSEAHRKIVSTNTKIWNKKRTPEFNQWCARKAQAANKKIKFDEPKPEKIYLN